MACFRVILVEEEGWLGAVYNPSAKTPGAIAAGVWELLVVGA
jgi:hypothetical protein